MNKKKVLLLLFTAIAVLITVLYFVLPPRYESGFFSGNDTFSFCGVEKTGYYIKYQGSCKRFCRHVTGQNCEDVRSKTQKLETGICYGYLPQTMMGDPCAYCSVKCVLPE